MSIVFRSVSVVFPPAVLFRRLSFVQPTASFDSYMISFQVKLKKVDFIEVQDCVFMPLEMQFFIIAGKRLHGILKFTLRR